MADEDEAAAAPGTSGAHHSFWAYVAGQARWLGPLTGAVVLVTVVLIVVGPRDSEALATIFAFDLAYLGVVLPPMMLMWERSGPPASPAKAGRPRPARRGLRPAHRRLLWATAAFSWLAATTLVTVATVRVVGDDDGEEPTSGSTGLVIDDGSPGASPADDCRAPGERDPESFLSGEVTIGIDGEHPGWSYRVDDDRPPTGFDVELARFLGDELGFDPVFRDLLPVERETALQTCDVDLVIANYSMTRSRSLKVDFAGPYFLDNSGLLCNDAKVACDQVVPDTRVCVVEGTIAWEKILRAEKADSIRRCLERFVDEDDDVAAYSTDRTILEAYDHHDDEIDASIGTAEWQDIPGHPVSAEEYGIGLPNDSPALCEALAAAVREFLDARWATAFTEHLAPSQSNTGHEPTTTDVRCYDG